MSGTKTEHFDRRHDIASWFTRRSLVVFQTSTFMEMRWLWEDVSRFFGVLLSGIMGRIHSGSINTSSFSFFSPNRTLHIQNILCEIKINLCAGVSTLGTPPGIVWQVQTIACAYVAGPNSLLCLRFFLIIMRFLMWCNTTLKILVYWIKI